jgi:hypothetical protein
MSERTFYILVSVVLAACVAFLIFATVKHEEAKKACEDRGGTYQKYDCSTSYITNSCGNGCYYTTPIETCSYRCVGDGGWR